MRYQPRRLQPAGCKQGSRPVSVHEEHEDTGFVDHVVSLWSSTTKRTVPVSSEHRIRLGSLESEWEDVPRSKVTSAVRSAAYLPPDPEDLEDMQRLFDVLTSPDTRYEAEELMYSVTTKIIPFSALDDIRALRDQILQKCGYQSASDMDYTEREALTRLLSLSPSRISLALSQDHGQWVSVKKILAATHQESIYPSVSKDNQFTKQSLLHKASKSMHSSYSAGQKENDMLNEETMEADENAMKMLIDGYSWRQITAYHEDVPPGYWENVLKELGKPEYNGDLQKIVDALRDHYQGFHPDNRVMPEREN